LWVAGAPPAQATPAADACVPGVGGAIVAALKLRMRGAVEFDVTGLSCALDATNADMLVAKPAPGARVGSPVRFALTRPVRGASAQLVRAGEAVATVHVAGTAIRTTRDLPRGAVIAPTDVEQVETSLDGLPLRQILTRQDVVGALVRVPLRVGQLVDQTSIVPVPAVRSGDRVRAVVRTTTVEVETIAVAAESGAIDQVIRVVNPESRRSMRARVRAKGEVEVNDVP
jgi:flagella basal body P-ring formation protein FlgA